MQYLPFLFPLVEESLALDFVGVGGNLVGDSWSVESGSEESRTESRACGDQFFTM